MRGAAVVATALLAPPMSCPRKQHRTTAVAPIDQPPATSHRHHHDHCHVRLQTCNGSTRSFASTTFLHLQLAADSPCESTEGQHLNLVLCNRGYSLGMGCHAFFPTSSQSIATMQCPVSQSRPSQCIVATCWITWRLIRGADDGSKQLKYLACMARTSCAAPLTTASATQ